MLVRFGRAGTIKNLIEKGYQQYPTSLKGRLTSSFRFFSSIQKPERIGQQNVEQKTLKENDYQNQRGKNTIVAKPGSQFSVDHLSETDNQYQLVERRYNEKKVPGLQERKYSDLNSLQQQIVSTSKFDLFNPAINPKTSSTNSYPGLTDEITEISLGNVKIKGKNQVFLSQVDVNDIPADLDIRFDQQKQLKVIGKQVSSEKYKKQDSNIIEELKQKQMQMKIANETIEQKTMKDHFQSQFGFGLRSYKYSNWKSINRIDVLLTILFLIILSPVQTTLAQLYQCYKTTKAIQDERMKQVHNLKKASYQKVLFENKQFKLTF